MRRFLAGKVSVVEDGRMDGYYEEGEKYRNKRNYVPLVYALSPLNESFSLTPLIESSSLVKHGGGPTDRRLRPPAPIYLPFRPVQSSSGLSLS